jgi:hypothetical protein
MDDLEGEEDDVDAEEENEVLSVLLLLVASSEPSCHLSHLLT